MMLVNIQGNATAEIFSSVVVAPGVGDLLAENADNLVTEGGDQIVTE